MNRIFLHTSLITLGLASGIALPQIFESNQTASTQSSIAPEDYRANYFAQYFNSNKFKFVKAVDGDTLDISDMDEKVTRIRLNGIDTPERGKPHARQSTQALEALCRGQNLRIEYRNHDNFDRAVANLYCDDIHVNAALVENGAAIVSIKYAQDKTLYALQDKARQSCKGMWQNPIETNYPEKHLKGHSPVQGSVKITAHKNCTQLSKL